MYSFDKELEKIKSIIDTFLEPFGLTCFIGTDFSFYYFKNLVEVSFVCPEKDNIDFMKSVSIHNPSITMDIFLWSLLHEIGHSETIDEIEDFEMDFCKDTKKLIREGLLPKEEYYNCLDEYLATEWAVNFANENTNALFNFWNELKPRILDFYSKIEIVP